jgi:hypothetical protein
MEGAETQYGIKLISFIQYMGAGHSAFVSVNHLQSLLAKRAPLLNSFKLTLSHTQPNGFPIGNHVMPFGKCLGLKLLKNYGSIHIPSLPLSIYTELQAFKK